MYDTAQLKEEEFQHLKGAGFFKVVLDTLALEVYRGSTQQDGYFFRIPGHGVIQIVGKGTPEKKVGHCFLGQCSYDRNLWCICLCNECKEAKAADR